MLDRQVLHLPHLALSYLIGGNGLECVLLLHGMADNALVWSSLAESLGNSYRIIAPDLRGHGESSKNITDYSFTTIISDLSALLEHLGVKKVHILAHSWSAKAAAIWAIQEPHRFYSLILVDPFFMGRFPSWFRLTFPLLYRTLPFLKVVGTFSDRQTVENIARTLKQYRGWSPLQQQVFDASIEPLPDGTWKSKFPPEARDFIFEEIMQVEGLTEAIAVPTLFVKPAKGLNRTELQLKTYRKYCQNLQICEVIGNHWAFLGEPEAFNEAIANFLASLPFKA